MKASPEKCERHLTVEVYPAGRAPVQLHIVGSLSRII